MPLASATPIDTPQRTGKTLEVDRQAHLFDDPRRELGHIPVADVEGEDDEFVPADARDDVATANVLGEHLGGMHQHRITGGMAERVVDFFEAIEIDVQDRKFLPLPATVMGQVRQCDVELAAIGERGQRIMQRIVLDPVLGKLELDVLGDRLVLGRLQPDRHQHVFSGVEGDAHDLHLAARRLVDLADRAHIAHRTVIGDHAADESMGIAALLEVTGAFER